MQASLLWIGQFTMEVEGAFVWRIINGSTPYMMVSVSYRNITII